MCFSGTFECDKCGKTFALFFSFLHHKKKDCRKDFVPVCHICDLTFKHPGSLARHIKNMHNPNVKVFQCEYCSFKTNYKCNWKVHVLTKHRM